MDLNDFIPFKNQFDKAYHGITTNATHTSENPIFDELRVRRFGRPMSEVSELIVEKIERWIGWNLINKKTTVGGMTSIRAEVSSVILFGMKIKITFGLFEEMDAGGYPITTVNAKAETHIDARGDLGESRRAIRMMLGAMDFNFRTERVSEEDYQYRSMDVKGADASCQAIFDEVKLQHQTKPENINKATAIEFKKKPAVQAIQIRPTLKQPEPVQSPSDTNNILQSMTTENSLPIDKTAEETKPSKPKITIVTTKKNL